MRKGSTVSIEVRERIRQTCISKGLRPPSTKGMKLPLRSIEHRRKIGERSRGVNCSFWKDGRTTLVKQIKNLSLYKEWRKAVFERDNYTCIWCGIRGSIELAPDHISPLSSILEANRIKTQEDAINCVELWNVNNGRTLCHPCHKKTDTYGWKIHNNRR